MRLAVLIREGVAAAKSAKVPSALVALVVGAMCVAAIVMVGRQAGVEASVARELAGPSARMLTVADTTGGEVLSVAVVESLRTLDNTEAMIATALPTDVVNGALGAGSPRIALTAISGGLDEAIALDVGRIPGAGEAVVPRQRLADLGMEAPVGFLQSPDGGQWAIVGSFEPLAPFDSLGDSAIALLTPEHAAMPGFGFHQVRIVSDEAASVGAVQRAALAIIDADPRSISVTSAAAAARTSQAVAGALTGFGRGLLLLILGVGAFFVAVVVLADVLIRRRDLGRRRTLGISRGDLVALVMVRTCVPAAVGALLGTFGGMAAVARMAATPVSFALGAAVLGVLTAALACIPPALLAAMRDPVDVMRTP